MCQALCQMQGIQSGIKVINGSFSQRVYNLTQKDRNINVTLWYDKRYDKRCVQGTIEVDREDGSDQGKVFFLNFIYFGLRWVFVDACGLSLVVASGGFSLWWLLLLRSTGSRRAGFSSCGTTGLVAPRHVGSSRTRARTCVPCIGRRILNHCATREVLGKDF